MPEWGDLLLVEGGTDRDRAVAAAGQPGQTAYPTLEPGSKASSDNVIYLTSLGTKSRSGQGLRRCLECGAHGPGRGTTGSGQLERGELHVLLDSSQPGRKKAADGG